MPVVVADDAAVTIAVLKRLKRWNHHPVSAKSADT
jgi:hypothetical protein